VAADGGSGTMERTGDPIVFSVILLRSFLQLARAMLYFHFSLRALSVICTHRWKYNCSSLGPSRPLMC
jgi:hypothetical protein